MNISYCAISHWYRQNWKLLIAAEIFFLGCTALYLLVAPRIFEADFAIRVPKVQIESASNGLPTSQWNLLISGIDMMRSLQNPLDYPKELVEQCMGEDSNANRKKWVNSNQMHLMNNGDVIHFSVRIEGRKRTTDCAYALEGFVIEILNKIYNEALAKGSSTDSGGVQRKVIQLEPPLVVAAIRISDGPIRPDIFKTWIAALIGGIFLGIFSAFLRNKYRA